MHAEAHSVLLGVFAAIWCFAGGILFSQFVLCNVVPSKQLGSGHALSARLRLARTEHYLDSVVRWGAIIARWALVLRRRNVGFELATMARHATVGAEQYRSNAPS